MKKLLIVLLVLIVSVWAALKIKADPGYLMIVYHDYVIDMPLWLGVLIFIVTFFVLIFVWRLLKEIYFTPKHIVEWYKEKSFARVRRRTVRGFLALAEGRWKDAEQLLSKNIDKRHTALLNCLGAAIAAQLQGKELERDEYLRIAHTYHSHAQIAIGLTQARMQEMQGQYEQCLASLRRLQVMAPDHKLVLNLMKKVLLELKAWQELLDVLPDLEKYKIITADETFRLTQQAYVALLIKAKANGGDAVEKLWQEVPKKWTMDAELLIQYIPHLISHGEHDEAENLLRQSIKQHYDSRLARLYGLISPTDKDKQLKTAQQWLKTHPEDPLLLMTVGRLLYQHEIWGQAKEFLLKSLTIAPNPETYLLLGDLFAKMQSTIQSQEYYQQGLQLACQRSGE
ncbi:MAG: heme biosynthesis HemY N-terminal domain-containing protein [Gammaproteobacteria bacterium]|jgi:HemY protein